MKNKNVGNIRLWNRKCGPLTLEEITYIDNEVLSQFAHEMSEYKIFYKYILNATLKEVQLRKI